MPKQRLISVDPSSDRLSTAKAVNRVAFGSLAGFMGQGINVLRQILLIPLFLSQWGTPLYGEWTTLYALVGYLTLADFGMQMYVVNRLNQSYSVGDLDEYTSILHSALLLYLGIVTVMYCIFAVGVFALPVNQWLNINLMSQSTFWIVALFLSARLLFAIPLGLINGLYRTFGEYPRGAMVYNSWQFTSFCLTALILVFGGGVLPVATVELITLVAVTFFVLYDVKKRHLEVRIGLQASDWRLALTFLGPGALFSLIQIATGLTTQGSVLVISAFAGGAISVAVFAIHRTLTNLLRQFIGFVASALWPELTTLEARGEYDKLRIVHMLSVKAMFAGTIFLGIWLHFVGKDIIEIWTSNRIVFDQMLFDVLLLYLIVQTPYSTSGTFLAASNRHKYISIASILSAILGVGLALILVRYSGMVGVVAGLLIADVLVSSWYVPLNTCRVIGESFKEFNKGILTGLPLIAIIWGLGWLLSHLTLPAILFIPISGVSLILVGGILGWFFWLNKQERFQLLRIKTAFLNKGVS